MALLFWTSAHSRNRFRCPCRNYSRKWNGITCGPVPQLTIQEPQDAAPPQLD
jgi:hypothetical protein